MEGPLMERVELVTMHAADFEVFLERVVEEYASQSVAAGRVEEEGSREWARAETERLLPDGAETMGAHLLRIVAEQDRETTIGSIWCSADPNNPRYAFVYDLYVYPEHRGKGFAFAAMSKLETILRAEGYDSVGLHVYEHNLAAMKLYDKLHYQTSSRVLRKDLS